jgi:DNA polymerase-1
MAVISDEVGRAWVVQATPDSRFPQWVYNLIERPDIVKAGSNIKFDYKWHKRFGHEIVNMWDTSTAEHVIDCTNPKKDLKSLTFKYCPKLGDYSKAHRDLVRERGGWEYVEDDEQYDYCGGDGEASIAAYDGQRGYIEQHGLTVPHQLMLDLYPVLAEMEHVGSAIDMDMNEHLDDLYSRKLEALRAEIVKVLGPININSVKQLAAALKKAVPDIKLSKRTWERAMGDEEEQEATTARFVLEREAHKHEVIPMVLEFRKYRVRHSTFIKGVREKYASHHHGQWFVHPTYRPDVTETYRLSSQAPNDQNAPRKDNDDPELSIKKQVISRFKGGKIIEADQSQIEIRIAAWLSQDEKMLKAIASGEDIHYSMAAIMLEKKIPPAGEEETCDPAIYVTELERTECKHRTFLILYGGGAKKLAQDLKISRRAAQRLIDEYFDTFTGLRDFIDKTHAGVREHLMVDTVFGFRRRFVQPEQWDSPEGWTIQRQSFNTKVQSAAVCVTYASMIYVHEQLRARELRSKLIKQVHDSMVFDVYPGEEHQIAELARESMETAGELIKKYGVLNLDVPLHSDVEIGDNWAEVHAYQLAA